MDSHKKLGYHLYFKTYTRISPHLRPEHVHVRLLAGVSWSGARLQSSLHIGLKALVTYFDFKPSVRGAGGRRCDCGCRGGQA